MNSLLLLLLTFDGITFPQPPSPPLSAVTELPKGVWYVIESDQDVVVLDSPQGHVSVISTGPTTALGLFVDGKGEIEVRRYAAKHVFLVQAIKPGNIELIVIPVGLVTATDVVRRPLAIMGMMPNPPPEPDPAPEPEPAGVVSLAVVEDSMNRSPDAAIVLNALVGWEQAPKWRLYDKSTEEPAGKAAIVAAGTMPLPVVVMTRGTRVSVHPLPKTFAEFKTLVAK